VAEVDEKWVYTHDRDDRPIDLGEGIDRCVVMAIEMDYDGLRRSPSLAAGIRTGVGYSRMAMAQACLGQFIRNLGYRAIACGNDTAMSAPLAVAAGLGEVGRNGILITREFGPRVRLCKVFTDLPLVPDRPIDIGVRRFCEVCKRCAEECPSRSIPRGEPAMEGPTESNADGVMKWRVNPEACYRYWIRNGASCSNCIRVCPWNKPNDLLHRAVSGLVKTAPALNPLIVAADKWLGFGQHRKGGETL
jgi:reductive dehalogenase